MASKTRKSQVTGKDVVDYVDKKKFTQAVIDYVTVQNERKEQGLPQEKIPEYIGDCIIKIVNGLSNRYNFRKYTWRDEMVGDAIIASVRAIPKFDPERSKNAYGFITQCSWFVFVNRIKLEKKQIAIKENMIFDPTFEFFETMGQNDEKVKISKQNSIETYLQGKL